MFDRRFFAEAVTLVVLAVICGSVANVVAARDRKLAFVGDYPNAQIVPTRPAATVPQPATVDPVEPVMAENPDPLANDPATTTATDPADPPAAEITPAPVAPPPATKTTTAAPPAVAEKPAAKPMRQFLPTPDKTSEEITNEEARYLQQQGALFLDARRSSAWIEGRIPGARSVAVWESDVDDKVMALFSELTDQKQPIVVYCTGGNCEDSHMLAQKLWGIGYETVLVYTDGWPGWLSIGGAVER